MVRRALALLASLALAGAPAGAAEAGGADEAAIRQLNDDYVRAFLARDVARFRGLLAADFVGVLADGRVIDKSGFLAQAATPPDARDLRLHDVVIRVYGDSALVGAAVDYRRAGGSGVRTRYTSVYVRRAGRWEIVWVQWTRVSAP
ncbi:MAG TPA: nuclear transport factor 2 family protein [Opitutaceae bacterium]|nr:nuclear transport factor 2 family protein [Opitutaceae bacterium]